MIHIIKHHIGKGSYTPWYDIIEFTEPHIYHEFDNKLDIERKLIGDPPYENELVEHLKQISPTRNDIVVFDYNYLRDYEYNEFVLKINKLSHEFNNCKFLIFDDDNTFGFSINSNFTLFSNLFGIEKKDEKFIYPKNCNYYRYRAPKQDYWPHLKYIVNTFQKNIRLKKMNLIIGVDKKERLEIFKYIHNIGLDKDSYLAYSGFVSGYNDSELSDSLLKFKKEKIPTILDTSFKDSLNGNVNVELPPLPITLNSYISCIIETQILIENSIHLSEKSWNPFISKNIPLILGSNFLNTYLKDIGFWLADDLFDLSIKQNITDVMNQYKKNLDVINNMSMNDLHSYYIKNKHHIESNFDLLENQKFIYNSLDYKNKTWL